MTVFEVWKDNGIALIEPEGALNAHAVPALREALDDAAKLTAHHTIVIIDSAVTMSDPVALGALLSRHTQLQKRGGTLAVVGTDGPIARLLRRVSIGDSVPVFDGLDEALANLTGKADR